MFDIILFIHIQTMSWVNKNVDTFHYILQSVKIDIKQQFAARVPIQRIIY